MLRDLWDRLVGRRREAAAEYEAERRHMSPEERRIAGESVDDIAADQLVREHLGGVDPERLLDQDRPPRD